MTGRNLAKRFLQDVALRGRFLWKPSDPRLVALTFDDGPVPGATDHCLDLLAEAGVAATFFFRGDRAAAAPALVRRAVREGHAIGNHTYSHVDLSAVSAEQAAREVSLAGAVLGELVGQPVTLFRPPFGRLTVARLFQLVRLGQQIVHWSVTFGEHAGVPAPRLLEWARVVGRTGGDVVVLHEIHDETRRALPALIAQLRARGLAFERADRLMGATEGRP